MQSTHPEGAREPFRPSPSYPEHPLRRAAALQALRDYAGVRVSWSAIVAGAVAMLATTLLLIALALGIVAAATSPSESAIRGGSVALWVCAMVAILVGAVVGGAVAGFVRGSGEDFVGAGHGLLAWGLTFVLAFGFQLLAMRDLARAAVAPVHEVATATTNAGIPTLGAAAGAAQVGRVPLLQPSTHAADTLYDNSRGALRSAAGIGWSSFFVWLAAGLLAAGAAEMLGRRFIGRRGPIESRIEGEREPREPMVPTPGE